MESSILNQLNIIRSGERKKVLDQALALINNKGKDFEKPPVELINQLNRLSADIGMNNDFRRALENQDKLSNLLIKLYEGADPDLVQILPSTNDPAEFHRKIKAYLPEQPVFKRLDPFFFLNKDVVVNKEMISVIVLNENGAPYLDDFFNSFAKFCSFNDYRITMFDRASADNSIEIASSWCDRIPLEIIRFDERLTASYLYNTAVDNSSSQYILFVANSISFNQDILQKFLETIQKDESTGITGASLLLKDISGKSQEMELFGSILFRIEDIPGVPDIPFPTINTRLLLKTGLDKHLKHYRKEGAVFVPPGLSMKGHKPFPASHTRKTGDEPVMAVTGHALFCRRQDLIASGGFDLNFTDGFEEADLCLKFARRLKKKTILSHEIRVEMNNEDSLKTMGGKFAIVNRYNLGTLINNHGGYLKRKYPADNTEPENQHIRIAIKTPAFDDERTLMWGDYHFANSLKNAFVRKGYQARVDLHNFWYDNGYMTDDVVIVLRGTKRYHTRGSQVNILWNISHPEQVTEEEYKDYDYVFSASTFFADELKKKYGIMAENLLQCTDAGLFYPDKENISEEEKNDVLFVGNSREVMRKSVAYSLEKGIPLAVYGSRWEQFLPAKMIKGNYLKNEALRKYYSNCNLLLNDHWRDIADHGFISNRIFDALACGAIVLTDRVKGIEDVISKGLYYYNTADELEHQIKWLKENGDQAKRLALENAEIIAHNHSFDQRAGRILEIALRIHNQKTE